MQLGDISVFVGPDGSKHVGVVTEVNSDASVDICILKTSQRSVKLSPGSEPGTFFDPTMPVDAVAQDSTAELPMREPAAGEIAGTIPGSVMSSVPPETAEDGNEQLANLKNPEVPKAD
jgi:hypothetical protein